MRTGKNIFILIIAFSLVVSGCVSSGKIMKSYEDLEIPPLKWTPQDYYEFDLENEVSCLLVEDHEVPLINFYIAFPSPADPAEKTGLSELASWALRNGGSMKISSDSLNNLLEYKGAYIGVGADQEQLWISGLCLRSDLELLMSISRELIDMPAYPQDMIEFKRSQMLERIRRSNDNPRRISFRELNKLLYPEHPWGRENSIESVQNITEQDLQEYHRQVFQPKGSVFGVSGDITKQDVRDLAAKYLGNLKSDAKPVESLPAVGKPADPGVYYAYKDLNQAFILAGHQSISYNDPRRPAAEIMNYILGGGGFQSILMQKIRVDEGLAYSVASWIRMPESVTGSFMAMASTRLEEAGRTISMMDTLISNYREFGPTADQFEKAKQSYINSYVWKFEKSDDILQRLVNLKHHGLSLDMPQRDLEAYQNLTLEDVQQAAHELLHPDKMILVIIGDKVKMDQPLENFGKVTEIELN